MKKSELIDNTKLFLASKEHANLLPDILLPLYSKGGTDLLQSVKCFKNIFNEVIRRGDFDFEAHEEGRAEREYSIWLRDRYIEGLEDLAKIMQTKGSPKLREIGVEILISFHLLEQELLGKFPNIDHKLIIVLIEAILEPSSLVLKNSSKLLEFLVSHSFRQEFMQTLQNILQVCGKSSSLPKEEWMQNVLKLIRIIIKAHNQSFTSPAEEEEKKSEQEQLVHSKIFKKKLSGIWNLVMKWRNMTPAVVRQIVIMLPEQVMQHLERPVLMSDFLLESFKIGGPLGVLSLRGIFVLMLKHNFEVPDFYTKLYSLFELPVLTSGYRARFFRCSADFLASKTDKSHGKFLVGDEVLAESYLAECGTSCVIY